MSKIKNFNIQILLFTSKATKKIFFSHRKKLIFIDVVPGASYFVYWPVLYLYIFFSKPSVSENRIFVSFIKLNITNFYFNKTRMTTSIKAKH